MIRTILHTKDGSSTIYIPELDEHYHSIHGAVQESVHVFIQSGLKQVTKNEIRIFEMGFGTGLNCLLTWLNTGEKTIHYTSIEKYPVEFDMAAQLNYAETLKLDTAESETFLSLHRSEWDKEVEINENFSVHKVKADIKTYEHTKKYDLVYFDAFAPNVQPGLWSFDVFKTLYNSMDTNGILTTYCAKGDVRRTMQKCGFGVERIPGPPGKKEMLRCIKQ